MRSRLPLLSFPSRVSGRSEKGCREEQNRVHGVLQTAEPKPGADAGFHRRTEGRNSGRAPSPPLTAPLVPPLPSPCRGAVPLPCSPSGSVPARRCAAARETGEGGGSCQESGFLPTRGSPSLAQGLALLGGRRTVAGGLSRWDELLLLGRWRCASRGAGFAPGVVTICNHSEILWAS